MNSSSVVASSVARRLRGLSASSVSSVSSSMSSSSSTAATNPNSTSTSTAVQLQRRFMGSGGGTRGARGHGWWVNYRAGKGGRHLQGTYSHLDLDSMAEWNDAIFKLGRQLAYLDVRVESLADDDNDADDYDNNDDNNNDDNNQQHKIHRLTLELATEVLPLATDNVVKLIQSGSEKETGGSNPGYLSSTLHRVEKGVGILGGLVDANPNHNPNNHNAPVTKRRMGICHPDHRSNTSPTAMDVSSEKLVLNHLPGVITMLQPRIGEIDSRFLVLSHNAPHLDGVSVAVGRLVGDDGLERVQEWESSLITSHGVPTNVVLRIVRCGLLDDDNNNDNDNGNGNGNDEVDAA